MTNFQFLFILNFLEEIKNNNSYKSLLCLISYLNIITWSYLIICTIYTYYYYNIIFIL